ncbi:hypothetical protein D3C75_967730 [compost metagenome]
MLVGAHSLPGNAQGFEHLAVELNFALFLGIGQIAVEEKMGVQLQLVGLGILHKFLYLTGVREVRIVQRDRQTKLQLAHHQILLAVVIQIRPQRH